MEETVVGRYKLLRRIAAGGMGEVFLAAQTGPAGFEKVVALKRLLPTVAGERELVRLFLDEARLVARLSHRNICQIVELGEDGGGYFVAMEYIHGPSVRNLMDRVVELGLKLPPALAFDIAAQVADALAYAYSAPGRDGQPLHIIHRDVTPQNILISIAGDVKLIDFGVAKSAEQSHVTQGGTVKGKMAYMSPEQSRGNDLDQRSDLFSLGIVLAEMLTGINPFWRRDIVQTVLAIQNDAAPAVSAKDLTLAPADAVVERLLAKEPEERFADANEVYEELTAIRQEFPRPPKRLGPFVSDFFAEDIEALIREVTDSGVRDALERGAAAEAKARKTSQSNAAAQGTPATNPATRPASGVRRATSGEMARTFVREATPVPGAFETVIRTDGARNEATVVKSGLDEEFEAAQPARRESSGISAGVVIGLTVAALLSAGGVYLVAPRIQEALNGPPPKPSNVTGAASSAARTPPLPEPQPPVAAKVEPAVAATPSTNPPPPPPTAPAPATLPSTVRPEATAPSPPPPPAKTPEVEAKAGDRMAAAFARASKKPVEPIVASRPKEHRAAAKPATVPAPATAAPEPPPAPPPPPPPAQKAIAAVNTGGALGPNRFDLFKPSGHETVGHAGDFTLSIDYKVSGSTLNATLTSEPWAIVSIDGVRSGKTPVELPALTRRPISLELTHPGVTSARALLAGEVEP